MTPRDNFLRTIHRRNPAWVPFDFGVSKGAMAMFRQHLGQTVDVVEHFRFDGRWIGPSVPTSRPTPDWRSLYFQDGSVPPEARIDDEWGVASIDNAASDDSISVGPLRGISSVEELEAYPWPDDVGTPRRYVGMRERVQAAQAAGFPVYGGGLNFFEHPWGICGFAKLMEAMAADEPWARRLFARHAEDLVRMAEQIALTGVDVLQTGSDVALQGSCLFRPAMWRDWIFPLMRDAIAAARRIKPDILVYYHSCGNVTAFIDGFIEAGVDILDPLQPESLDIFSIKRQYGERLAFHGGIGVQTVMPFGTAQEVRDTVRRVIDGMSAGGGGYICSPAHMIKPEVPWENVIALVETVKEYGHP